MLGFIETNRTYTHVQQYDWEFTGDADHMPNTSSCLSYSLSRQPGVLNISMTDYIIDEIDTGQADVS